MDFILALRKFVKGYWTLFAATWATQGEPASTAASALAGFILAAWNLIKQWKAERNG